jgi:hypothetical protein
MAISRSLIFCPMIARNLFSRLKDCLVNSCLMHISIAEMAYFNTNTTIECLRNLLVDCHLFRIPNIFLRPFLF